MNPARRKFWKFLAAAPAAAVGALVASDKPAISNRNIRIQGSSVALINCHLENAGIEVVGGASEAQISGVHFTGG